MGVQRAANVLCLEHAVNLSVCFIKVTDRMSQRAKRESVVRNLRGSALAQEMKQWRASPWPHQAVE